MKKDQINQWSTKPLTDNEDTTNFKFGLACDSGPLSYSRTNSSFSENEKKKSFKNPVIVLVIYDVRVDFAVTRRVHATSGAWC
jgi:hypothetical protein